MKKSNFWILIVIVIGLMLLSVVFFPPRNVQETGSTYGKRPDGYGAWYAYMEKKELKLQRWQKSEQDFINESQKKNEPVTFLRVFPELTYRYFSEDLQKWVKKGNRLVLIGINAPATNAPFRSKLQTKQGIVAIETTRRFKDEFLFTSREDSVGKEINPQMILKDVAGTIVWQYSLGKGQVIFASTKDLAANAYQRSPGNFSFMSFLVGEGKMPIVIDEYLHGYIAKETLQKEKNLDSWLDYLLRTPLLILFCEAVIIIAMLLTLGNRRFGVSINIDPPPVNNSFAYIEALGAVLYKANSHQFVITKISKAEQIYLQQHLGLGNTLVPLPILGNAWQKQTGRSANELINLLEESRSVPDILQLIGWLKKVYLLRDHLKNKNPQDYNKGISKN